MTRAGTSAAPLPSSPRERSLRLFWIVVITLLIVQRPLASPDFWWHQARGRAVVQGTVAPSRALLALDRQVETDWLSGLPGYLLLSAGGIHAAAAIPSIAAALLAYLALYRKARSTSQWVLIVTWPLALLTARPALEPGPPLWDIFALATLWSVLEFRIDARRLQVLTFLIMAAWANFGLRPFWGLLVLWLAPSTIKSNDKSGPGGAPRLEWLLLAAVLGGMMTPRGPLTWRDSLVLFAPAVFAEVSTDHNSSWLGIFPVSTAGAEDVTFLALWLICCGVRLRHKRTSWLSSSVVLIGALLCRGNLPLCGVWMLLELRQWDVRSKTLIVSRRSQYLAWSAAITIAVLSGIDASGHGLPPYRRLGWGLAQEIHPDLLNVRLPTDQREPTIGWAADQRSVGVVSWLHRDIRMVDHPQRSLLGGRAMLHAALIADFLGAHRARYRRDDGSWGGWVEQLKNWNVTLLFAPAEEEPVIAALTAATWKPVDLDSATVPFVSTYDTRFAQSLVESLRQQAFVDVGPWQPSLESYAAPGWRYDFIEALGGGPDPLPAIRQSQFFRALDVPLAACRALMPVRQRISHRRLTSEVRDCQNDLLFQEWSTFGAASEFRQYVHYLLTGETADDQRPWLLRSADKTTLEPWRTTIELYLNGDLRGALESLPRETAQQRYGAAMLWLELGETRQAYQLLNDTKRLETDRAMAIAARYWRDQLQPFVEHPQP